MLSALLVLRDLLGLLDPRESLGLLVLRVLPDPRDPVVQRALQAQQEFQGLLDRLAQQGDWDPLDLQALVDLLVAKDPQE